MENRSEEFDCFTESYDSGYLVLGAIDYYPDTKGFILKTDINGNLLYQIKLGMGSGLTQCNYPRYIESTLDGGMIICGSDERFSINDIAVTKLDVCGDFEWCKIFRTDDNPDWGRVIHQLPDGGYIMLTHQYNYAPSWDKIHLFRLDSNGAVLWIQPYALRINNPQLSVYGMTDMIITATGDYFMSGDGYWAADSIFGKLKAMTLMADSSRNEDWISLFRRDSINDYSTAFSTIQKGSGNLYIGACDVDEDYHPMLLTMDTAGNFLADALIQFPLINNKWADGYLIDPRFTIDGRLYAFTHYIDSSGWYPSLIGIHEIDSLGGWINSFLHPSAHTYGRMMITEDQKILLGANIGFDYEQDLILMKFNTSLQYDSIYTVPLEYDYLCPDSIVSKTVDLDCDIIVDVKDIPSKEEYYRSIKQIPITPAPNPASDEIRFMLKNTEHHKNIRIICYNMFGAAIASIPVNSGIDEAKMDVSDWTPGMYMAVVYSGNNKVGSTRFIKM